MKKRKLQLKRLDLRHLAATLGGGGGMPITRLDGCGVGGKLPPTKQYAGCASEPTKKCKLGDYVKTK